MSPSTRGKPKKKSPVKVSTTLKAVRKYLRYAAEETIRKKKRIVLSHVSAKRMVAHFIATEAASEELATMKKDLAKTRRQLNEITAKSDELIDEVTALKQIISNIDRKALPKEPPPGIAKGGFVHKMPGAFEGGKRL